MTSLVGDGEETPAPTWQLLRDGSFARYLLGNLLSNIGTWFQDIAAAILVFELTGSAAMVGAVTVAGYITSLLLAPLAGDLADRLDRRRILVAAHLGQAVVAGALALSVHRGASSALLVIGLSALLGVGRALVVPVLHAILPSLVRPRDLAPAVALQASTFHLARAVGPLLGALVVARLGTAAAFTVNGASFVAFAVLLPTVRVRVPNAAVGTVSTTGILGGVRYVRSHPRLLVLLLLSAVVGMTTDPVVTLGPSFAALLGQEATFVGALVTAFGLGSVCAVPFVGSVRSRVGPVRTGLAAILVACAGLTTMALARGPVLALVGAAVGGAGYLLSSTELTTTLQKLLQEDVRGRVMALWTMGFLGSRPLAAGLNGAIAELASPGGAVLSLVAVVLLAWLWGVRRYRQLAPWQP